MTQDFVTCFFVFVVRYLTVLEQTCLITSRSSLVFALGDVITNLPGLETPINFKQYSGYITDDPENDTRLFYWFVESQTDPSNDPLVLWLNGGPGCSSLGGFLGELGPFYVKPNLTLGINEYSWNKISNMIFLEVPAGVGFTKPDKHIAYNDDRTAVTILNFLLSFFNLYPHLRMKDFWMTGESYAGHYIPLVVAKLMEHNRAASPKTAVNLKGLMIGNPLTYLRVDLGGAVDYVFYHQLISKKTYAGLRKHCNFTFPYPPAQQQLHAAKCAEYQRLEAKEMGPINPLDIYADVCVGKQRYSRTNGKALLRLISNSEMEMSPYAKEVVKQLEMKSPFNPCQDNFIKEYLNLAKVQKAIHAEPTEWVDCNTTIDDMYARGDVGTSMLPVYEDALLRKGLKILVYTGDVDTLASGTGTRNCLSLLNMKTIQPWHPWVDSKGQVGGYMEIYDQLTYATVRGAGHQVPTYQPGRAFDLFSRFLKT